jgi:hypothetical protein
MKKECKYCKQIIIYRHKNNFAAHCTNCKKAPWYESRKQKISQTYKNKNPIKKYIFICPKCNKEFSQWLKISYYNNGSYRKYCSRNCANSRIQTQEINQKRSLKLKGKIHLEKRENRYCQICNKQFECFISSLRTTCGNKKCISKIISLKNKKYDNYNSSYIPSRKNKKYKDLHRIIMEKYLKIDLLRNEVIHHINGNKQDNRIENLQLMTNCEHSKLHSFLKRNKKYINK